MFKHSKSKSFGNSHMAKQGATIAITSTLFLTVVPGSFSQDGTENFSKVTSKTSSK